MAIGASAYALAETNAYKFTPYPLNTIRDSFQNVTVTNKSFRLDSEGTANWCLNAVSLHKLASLDVTL